MTKLVDYFGREPQLTLAVAESLSCGRLQAQIGSLSGASAFFLGGVTAYNLEQKVGLLGVDRVTAEPVNCVSGGVAEQMARGAAELFGASIGLATTGYAEPSEAHEVAEPFAWWALARRRPEGWLLKSGRVEFRGATRIEAQSKSAAAALDALLAHLRG